MCRLSWNLGASPSWNPQGLSRPAMGLKKKMYLSSVYIKYIENTKYGFSHKPKLQIIQRDQNVSVHLMITVQKTRKNILISFNHLPRTPCYTEHGLREHSSACHYMSGDWRRTLWTLHVTFCIVIIRCTETFWSPCIMMQCKPEPVPEFYNAAWHTGIMCLIFSKLYALSGVIFGKCEISLVCMHSERICLSPNIHNAYWHTDILSRSHKYTDTNGTTVIYSNSAAVMQLCRDFKATWEFIKLHKAIVVYCEPFQSPAQRKELHYNRICT
jgi:hypothetical protein